MDCDRYAATETGCNNQDVKHVRLRSQVTGNKGPNRFEGQVVAMCAACRKAHRGSFKIVEAPDLDWSRHNGRTPEVKRQKLASIGVRK